MRISDDRYRRDQSRLGLALRFIQLEARTSTIRVWTGLTDDRIRKLYRSYAAESAPRLKRHRGKSPELTSFFTRSPGIRQEAALLTSILLLHGVLPRPGEGIRVLPGMHRGAGLCVAFDTYRQLLATARISFEHAVFLLQAVNRGDEIRIGACTQCRGLVLADRYSPNVRRCLPCDQDRPTRSH